MSLSYNVEEQTFTTCTICCVLLGSTLVSSCNPLKNLSWTSPYTFSQKQPKDGNKQETKTRKSNKQHQPNQEPITTKQNTLQHWRSKWLEVYDIPLLKKRPTTTTTISLTHVFSPSTEGQMAQTRRENHILTNMRFLCKSFSHPFWVTIYPQIHNIHQVWTNSVIQNFCFHSIFFISLSVHLSNSFKILLHRYPSDQPRQRPPRPPNCWDCGVDGLTPQRPCRRRRRHAAQASSPHGDP